MKELTALLTPPLARAVVLTLLHFLWQGTLVALLLAAGDALMKRSTARLRYAAACAALVLMLALPTATLLRIWPRDAQSGSGAPTMIASGVLSATLGGLGETERPEDAIARVAPWIVLGWLTGVSTLSIRFLGGLLAAERLKRRGTRGAPAECLGRLAPLARALRVTQPVRLLESALVAVPTAIGVLRPVILLPAGIATGLTSGQLDSLLAHELAHIRRRDCLVNILQALAETLLFYHPAVWWVSGRIRIERENACDDLAVAVTGDASVYARALLALEERRALAPRLALAADGGHLWNRITRLFPASEGESNRASRWIAVLLALGGLLGLGIAARFPSSDRDAAAGSVSPAADRGDTGKDAAEPSAPLGGKVERLATPPREAQVAASASGADAPASAEPAESEDSVSSDENSPVPARGLLSPQQLIAFKIHGVTPEFIGQIVALGYERASPNDLLALRIHGATPEYISQMTTIFGKLPLEKYAELRIHGVTPDSLKELRAQFGKLSADEALAMRIHGVTPEFVRAIRSSGLTRLSLDEAVSFRIHGVTPEFVREIRDLGYPSITADECIAFRIHGITAESIRRMNRGAGGKLSADELLERQIHGHPDDEEEQ